MFVFMSLRFLDQDIGSRLKIIDAGMMELADVLDSKSSGGDTVRVRPPLPAPIIITRKLLIYQGLRVFYMSDSSMQSSS